MFPTPAARVEALQPGFISWRHPARSMRRRPVQREMSDVQRIQGRTGRINGCRISLSCFVLCASRRFVKPHVNQVAASAKKSTQNAGLVLAAAEHLEDPKLGIYKTTTNNKELEQIETYKQYLEEEAIQAIGASAGTPCSVDVHYSWACLERLYSALELDCRGMILGSILLPPAKNVSPEQLGLVRRIGQLQQLGSGLSQCTQKFGKGGFAVFQATGNLIDAGLAIKGSRKNFCRFVVAFASKKLSNLKGPFLVINEIASSHSLGQILRSAYHFGIDSVILSTAAWQLLDSRAMRVSVGWGYHMDFHVATSIPEALRELHDLGIGLFAEWNESNDAEAIGPSESADWALLLGCEACLDSDGGAGDALEISRVRVPCHFSGTMDIAHAAAICMYELSGSSSLKP